MQPIIEVHHSGMLVREGGVAADVPGGTVQFAHLGCKVLGSLASVPPEIAVQWDARFGGRARWARKLHVQQRLTTALVKTAAAANVNGFVLWDTMRLGSDYWRPGKGLTAVADLLRQQLPTCEVTYERVDALCPPALLLKQFRRGEMSFGQYAQAYAEHLRGCGGVEWAAAAVLMAAARRRLAVFYCVDPYIPGYADPREILSDRPYEQRSWLPGLRDEGCHRVILTEEVTRFFIENGFPVSLFAVDPTSEGCHLHTYSEASRDQTSCE